MFNVAIMSFKKVLKIDEVVNDRNSGIENNYKIVIIFSRPTSISTVNNCGCSRCH